MKSHVLATIGKVVIPDRGLPNPIPVSLKIYTCTWIPLANTLSLQISGKNNNPPLKEIGNMTMKTLLKCLLILSTLTTPFTCIFAQQLSIENEDDIRAEINRVHKAEQEAFIKGDCEKVLSFFDEDANFDVNGIKSESLNFMLNFCKEIPRPYEIREIKNYNIHVFSDTSAHQFEVFGPKSKESSDFQSEVAIKVWTKKPEGWKIAHFFSTVNYDQ